MVEQGQAAGRRVERRRAKVAFWRGHLARQRRSGLSIRAYCARHGLSQASFYAWRAQLARREASRPKRPTFLPVTLSGGPSLTVEFQLASGLMIRVPAHDRDVLRAVWELVEPVQCSV